MYWLGGTSDVNALTHGGGNFHVSNNNGFSSSLVRNENPSRTADDINTAFKTYFNINSETIYPRLSSSIDATGHIDMWLLPLSNTKILVSWFASGEGNTTTNAAAANLQSRGYTVYRTPAWEAGARITLIQTQQS